MKEIRDISYVFLNYKKRKNIKNRERYKGVRPINK